MKQPKFMMYSSHDTQIGILWDVLSPKNFKPLTIPYSSFIQVELFKNQTCLKEKGTDSCFVMQITSNGYPLKFDLEGCRG